MLRIFHVLLAICISSLEKWYTNNLYNPTAKKLRTKLKNLQNWPFAVELYKLFIYFRDEAFISCIIWNYFLPFCRFSFFKMVSFDVKKLVSLIRPHLFMFVSISIALRDWPKKAMIYVLLCPLSPPFKVYFVWYE